MPYVNAVLPNSIGLYSNKAYALSNKKQLNYIDDSAVSTE